VVASGGGTGNAERAGSAGRRPDLESVGRETRVSRRSFIAAALLLAVCCGAPPLFAAGSQPVCLSPPGFQTLCLMPGPLGPGDRFGSAVAIGMLKTGDGVVAVGAYLSAVGGPESGAVYLFLCPKSGGGCSLAVQQPLHEAAGDWFGFDVAIDDTQDRKYLLVGAPRAHDGSGARTGAAYQFDVSDLEAGQVTPQGPLPIMGGHAGDEIGSAVALSGDCWAVGARSDGQVGAGAGSVYASCRKEQGPQKLLPAPAAGAEFGQSLSLDGNILAVGAPLAEPAGAVYIFEAVANVWQQQGTQLPTGGVPAGAAFGYAVAVSGTQVVVGAPLAGAEAGAAYLYSLAPAQGPKQLQSPHAASGAQFGVSVAFDRVGDPSGQRKILAGARLANGAQGAAYRFSSNGSPDLTLSSPNPQAGANFGFESAIRGGTLLVGAFLQNDGAGAAYLFASPTQAVTVALAAPAITLPESGDRVLLPVVVATSDGQPTAARVTVQVEAIAGAAPAGSHFQLLTHQVTLTIPAGQSPGLANAKMVQIDFVPDDRPCIGDETFIVELSNPMGAVLGTPSTERVTLRDDLAGLAIALAHPPRLMTGDDGAADHFTVALCSQPTAAVTVRFTGASAGGTGILTPSSLVFTPADWSRPQSVTVTGVEAPGCLGDLISTYAILLSTTSADARYAALSPPAAPTYSIEVANQHHDRTEIAAALTVSAACDGTVLYILVLTNTGECALDEVSTTQLVDSLSWEDLSLVAAAADLGTASVDFVANRVAWSGAIPPGAQATILVDAALQAGVVAGQQVANQAVLTYASRPGGPGDTRVTTNPAVFNAFAGCIELR
jgi:FG-GAP repeat